MSCLRPIWTYPAPAKSRHPVAFWKGKRPSTEAQTLFDLSPFKCRRCLGCHVDRQKEWACRITHEAQMSSRSCFVTLTYNDLYLPQGRVSGSLDKTDLQRFFKRLRKLLAPQTVRFFAVGEYGDLGNRPHYHFILFGEDFRLGSKQWRNNSWIHPDLSSTWGKGHVQVDPVTLSSAAYVAGYVNKKLYGLEASDHYEGRTPEFATMSKSPGLGASWIQKYKTDVYPEGIVQLESWRLSVPEYYDRLISRSDPDLIATSKASRIAFATSRDALEPLRLEEKERVLLVRANKKRKESPRDFDVITSAHDANDLGHDDRR